jgi:hypothetical protein
MQGPPEGMEAGLTHCDAAARVQAVKQMADGQALQRSGHRRARKRA